MHELAVSQALIEQVAGIVAEHGARDAERIVVAVGPLSGVEPALLSSAFTIARRGTPAEHAELEIEIRSIKVECRSCGADTEARANRLLCAACGDWRVRVTQGDDLTLLRVDLRMNLAPKTGASQANLAGARHV